MLRSFNIVLCCLRCSVSLKAYAHEDTSVGSWMMGLQATYIDDSRLCCSYSSQGKYTNTMLFQQFVSCLCYLSLCTLWYAFHTGLVFLLYFPLGGDGVCLSFCLFWRQGRKEEDNRPAKKGWNTWDQQNSKTMELCYLK